ncbi:uncharacterized protein LAJ45_06589 [Morchella importuna]|uniref:uncharacterized protein n=1 Tax=Morchella importuna TaxID=1174673 RepID=UPI001E8DF187|nr:uncharacterized protein LAJ45_06589 [Morchella importuna]KAH8149509.1 hypothetical protein LAJ45_06589 [Morchella importuna]
MALKLETRKASLWTSNLRPAVLTARATSNNSSSWLPTDHSGAFLHLCFDPQNLKATPTSSQEPFLVSS